MEIDRESMFLLILLLALQISMMDIVDMNHQCKQPVQTLLDCKDIDADDVIYQFSIKDNDITRIIFGRLRGSVDLQNLKFVNTINVETGEAQCKQLKSYTDTVTIQLSDTSIVCNLNHKDHLSTGSPSITVESDSTSAILRTSHASATMEPGGSTATLGTERVSVTTDTGSTSASLRTEHSSVFMSTDGQSNNQNTSDSADVFIITAIPGCVMFIIIIIFIAFVCKRRCKRYMRRRNSFEMTHRDVSRLSNLSDISNESSIIEFNTAEYKRD